MFQCSGVVALLIHFVSLADRGAVYGLGGWRGAALQRAGEGAAQCRAAPPREGAHSAPSCALIEITGGARRGVTMAQLAADIVSTLQRPRGDWLL